MNLKRFRLDNKMTQKALVNALSRYGFTCHQSFISLVERSQKKPPYEMMEAFKQAFPYALIDSVFFNGIRQSSKNSFAIKKEKFKEKAHGNENQIEQMSMVAEFERKEKGKKQGNVSTGNVDGKEPNELSTETKEDGRKVEG